MEEWAKAKELTSDAIEKFSQRMGIAHYDTLLARKDLANIYFREGLLDRAAMLEDEVLKDSTYGFGRDHALTLVCMHEKAIILKAQRRDAEAIQLMAPVVSRRERILGPFQDDTLMALQTLCEWCGKEKAVEILLDAEGQ